MRGLMRAAIAVFFLLLAGCAGGEGGFLGYQANATFPGEVASVEVPIFENRTAYTGVEREITDALIKELQARSPYRVVGAGGADTTLKGTVVRVETAKLSEARGTGLVQELLQTITVDFTWTDQRSGKVLVQRESFSSSEVYIPVSGVGERPDLANFAIAESLARDIVQTMQEQW